MKNKIKLLIFVIIGIIIFSNVVFAYKDLPSEVEYTIEEYIDCLEDNDENAFNYIDASNEELYTNTKEYLNNIIRMGYEIKDVKEENDKYIVEATIDAEGKSWSVSGFTVKFNIEEKSGKYVITDTTLYNYIGTENAFKFVGFVFRTIGLVFLGIIVVVLVIVFVSIKVFNKNSKKNENL